MFLISADDYLGTNYIFIARSLAFEARLMLLLLVVLLSAAADGKLFTMN